MTDNYVWRELSRVKVIELSDADPRYLIVEELPDRISMDDLRDWRYGKPLVVSPVQPDEVYQWSGTDWVRP